MRFRWWRRPRPGRRTARDFGLDPEATDSGALEVVLSALSGAFERARARDAVLAGFAEQDIATLYLGSSTGVRLSHVAADGGGEPGRAHGGRERLGLGRRAHHCALARAHGARGLAPARLGHTQVALEAGRYEVIMPPSAVADMMGMLDFDAFGGQDAEDGRTVFSREGGGTRVGETITTLPFTLYSDPFEQGIACTPFVATEASGSETSVFDNGLPSARTDWLHDGVLARLRYHRAGAARSGVAMAPYIDNLVLRCGGGGRRWRRRWAAGTVDDMVARTERGLLLTCLWYIREVDPATLLCTGLTRDGVYVD